MLRNGESRQTTAGAALANGFVSSWIELIMKRLDDDDEASTSRHAMRHDNSDGCLLPLLLI